jgi:hypothetical protein
MTRAAPVAAIAAESAGLHVAWLLLAGPVLGLAAMLHKKPPA